MNADELRLSELVECMFVEAEEQAQARAIDADDWEEGRGLRMETFSLVHHGEELRLTVSVEAALPDSETTWAKPTHVSVRHELRYDLGREAAIGWGDYEQLLEDEAIACLRECLALIDGTPEGRARAERARALAESAALDAAVAPASPGQGPRRL